ncbi:hypothetical protein PPYR_05360 [Photinus pyralis]|uniref:Uncharacterized protein n=1 Tax=Photinus pyralis TaxID=7054 RepID=A0A5N4AUL3_PHOPY|nr:uncharacterized protein LOC116166060 [Photinus pyralis]KAB0801006.1 hypothetical protein PPYR_05360 [Photinus pyralis]
MSIPRSSISDYPEHLNPFYEGDQKFKFWKFGRIKRSGSFGETLRNSLLFKSIRGKKSKEKDASPTPLPLRKNSPSVAPLHRQTLPTIYSENQSSNRSSTPVPLPRSRFSERVAKSSSQVQPQNCDVNQTAPNPFENAVAKPPTKLYIKRKKRRAPLPPSLDGCSVSSEYNGSKWSLTSEGTDMSTYSDTELTIDPEVSSRIAHITKEIQKMADEEHEPAYTTDIPDVVVSSIDAVQVDKSQSKELEVPIDENDNVLESVSIEDGVEATGPDVLHHTNCNDEEKAHLSSTESTEDLRTDDSLTNLINSINDDTTNVDGNDYELKEVDSLTNIINSINFTENEAFESKHITRKCDVEINGILNCDNETIEASLSDTELKQTNHVEEHISSSTTKEDVKVDHLRT